MIAALLTNIQAHIQAERLGWALLHFLWQGTAIVVVHAILRRLLGRSLSAQGRYLLACATLAVMVVSPVLTLLLIPSANSGPVWTISLAESQRLLNAVVVLWLLGVVAFSIRLAGAWRFTSRLRSLATPAAAEWQQWLEEIAARTGVKKAVRLLVSPLVEVPTVIGWLRPVVLIPVDFLAGLPAGHISALLAHELAHVRRCDYLANVLQSIAETVLFYHPAVWWISGQIRLEREQCCDDLAVAASGDVLAYARALADLELHRPQRLKPALAANGGSLVERIRRLIEPAQMQAEKLPGPMAAWTMTLLWLVGAAVASVHAAQTPAPVRRIAKPMVAMAAVLPATPVETPAVSPLAAVVNEARKTVLYDPVFTMPPVPESRGKSSAVRVPGPPENPPLIADARVNDTGVLSSIVKESEITVLAPPPAFEEPAPTFRAATRLVQIDVVARKWNSPATGLAKDDFTLFDNGKPQPIAVFSATSERAAVHAAVPLAAGAVCNCLEDGATSSGATSASATVVLLDQRNTSESDQSFVIKRLRNFVENRRNGDAGPERIGIYTFVRGGRLQVAQEITSDVDLLSRAAASLRPRDPGDLVPGEEDALPMETSDVLDAIGRHLASVPGRKNLIWISGGLPDLNPRMESAARALTDESIAFYAVEAGGLIGALSVPTPVMAAEFAGPASFRQLLKSSKAEDEYLNRIAVMARLAQMTGGMIFGGNNAIEDSIQKALDDADLGYTLGFYPQSAGEATWHKLKIKVNRPGVQVRYREKYFVPGAVPPKTELALPALMKNPLNATQVRMIAQAAPDPRRPGFRQVRVSVDLHDIRLDNQNNNWVGGVDFSFLVEGARAAHRVRGNVSIPGDQLAVALAKGLSLDDSIAVNEGRALHIVAQDRFTGAAGSVRIPLAER